MGFGAVGVGLRRTEAVDDFRNSESEFQMTAGQNHQAAGRKPDPRLRPSKPQQLSGIRQIPA
jgi:hypothetical protein